jgi:hypothetical protein
MMVRSYFQIEKRYYDLANFNGPMLTDTYPVLYPTLADAKARYELAGDSWFDDVGDEPYFAISEIEPSGFEIGYHSLEQRASA